jgi:hypothetical protein
MIHVVVSFVNYGKCVRVFRLGCFIMGNLENNLNIEFDSSFELSSNLGQVWNGFLSMDSSFGPSLDLVLETQIDNYIHNKSQD